MNFLATRFARAHVVLLAGVIATAACGNGTTPVPPPAPAPGPVPAPGRTDAAAPSKPEVAPAPAPDAAVTPDAARPSDAAVTPPAPKPDATPPSSEPMPPVTGACAVDPQRILADVRHLASPELRGRKPGDPGNELSVQYAEKQFAAAGLSPAGDNGTFRQAFAFRAGTSPGNLAHNVVGVLKGNDFTLAKQVVIVGGHIDHLGVNRDGAINYGADDNASGTAVVMELARLYKLCGLQPKRTMLFVAWNAEEMGLLGSRAYVAKPLFPLASTLANYTFDMVGAGDGTGALVFGGDDKVNSWITELLRATTAAAKLPHAIQVVPQKLASDHAPFVEKGVPSIFAFSRPDPHPGYHTPADDIDNIRLASLATIGQLFWETLRPLALGDEMMFLKRPIPAPPAAPAPSSTGRAAVAGRGPRIGGNGDAVEVVSHGCLVPVAP